MADSSRDQVLTDFMDCTGLENVDECIHILTQNNWDLMIAIKMFNDKINGRDEINNQATVPKHVKPPLASPPRSIKTNTVGKRLTTVDRRASNDGDRDGDDGITFLKAVPSPTKIAKTTSTAASSRTGAKLRELKFIVEYKDQTESITMCDSETVGQLKKKIFEKLHVPVTQQQFVKFVSTYCDDHTVLKDLHLQRETTIHMIASTSSILNGSNRVLPSSSSSGAAASRSTRTSTSTSHETTTSNNHDHFPITVKFEEKPGVYVPYELFLSSNFTIKEIKQEMERLCHLPIAQQLWKLPEGVKDTDQIKNTQLKRKAVLFLSRAPSSPSKTSLSTRKPKTGTPTRHHSDDDIMDVDSPTDNTHFLENDIVDISPSYRTTTNSFMANDARELLIPENCANDITGLENFTRVFHLRYGSTGPILYIGGLDEAIQESFYTSIPDRRPLAIYLHHDRSICANVFCTRVLATDTIVEYLANNYVVWAWDFTSDTNRTRFMESFRRTVDPQYAQAISKMEKDAFPLILILVRLRNSIEIVSIIEGKSTIPEVLESLMKSHDTFTEQRDRDMEEEIARKKREHLKKQQEDEYNQSLQADLAKEQARLADEQKQKAEKFESEQLEKKRVKEQRESYARLPPEPSETEKNLTKFKIRLPNDQGILMRRFRVSDTLQTLFDYLSSEGQFFGEYKLITTYPKRDLTTFKRTDTFEALKLFPQEQLILESL